MTVPILPNGQTLMAEKLLRIVNLIEAEVPGMPEVPTGVTVFITSSEWETLMGELKAKLPSTTPAAFFEQRHFLIGSVMVRNAGTDNQAAVMEANRMYAEKCGFEWKARELVTGRVDGV